MRGRKKGKKRRNEWSGCKRRRKGGRKGGREEGREEGRKRGKNFVK